MENGMIRKTIGKRREEKTVFEQVRWLNEQLRRMGVDLSNDDYLVRKVIGKRRSPAKSESFRGKC